MRYTDFVARLTGLAVAAAGAALVGRGRALAVSVGGVLTVAAVVGLAAGAGSPAGVLAIAAVSLALLFSGAATGRGGHPTQ